MPAQRIPRSTPSIWEPPAPDGCFAAKIAGGSLDYLGIHAGDVAWINPDRPADGARLVLARLNGEFLIIEPSRAPRGATPIGVVMAITPIALLSRARGALSI